MDERTNNSPEVTSPPATGDADFEAWWKTTERPDAAARAVSNGSIASYERGEFMMKVGAWAGVAGGDETRKGWRCDGSTTNWRKPR